MNPSDFQSTEDKCDDHHSRLDNTFTITDDKYSITEKHIEEPVRIPDEKIDSGGLILIHNDISLGNCKFYIAL